MTDLDQLKNDLWRCEHGLRPEDAPRIREQIKSLLAEQDKELLQSLEAARMFPLPFSTADYSKLEPRQPSWSKAMGYDEFILRRELREPAEGLP